MVDSAAVRLPIGLHLARLVSIRWRNKRAGPRGGIALPFDKGGGAAGGRAGRREGSAGARRLQRVAGGAEGSALFPPRLIAPPSRRDVMFLRPPRGIGQAEAAVGNRRIAGTPCRPRARRVSPPAAAECRRRKQRRAVGGCCPRSSRQVAAAGRSRRQPLSDGERNPLVLSVPTLVRSLLFFLNLIK